MYATDRQPWIPQGAVEALKQAAREEKARSIDAARSGAPTWVVVMHADAADDLLYQVRILEAMEEERITLAAARCTNGVHYGVPQDGERFDAAGGLWRGQRTCSECFSTVDLSAFISPPRAA